MSRHLTLSQVCSILNGSFLTRLDPFFPLNVIFSSSMFKTQIQNSRVGKKLTGHIWPLNDRLQTKMRSKWIWIVWKHFTIEQMNFASHWNRKKWFLSKVDPFYRENHNVSPNICSLNWLTSAWNGKWFFGFHFDWYNFLGYFCRSLLRSSTFMRYESYRMSYMLGPKLTNLWNYSFFFVEVKIGIQF